MITVIIPTYNEEDVIKTTISAVRKNDVGNLVQEIIIVDGGSSDETITNAGMENATIISSKKKGRAAQMNAGANAASSELLYFLHADSIPPSGYSRMITEAMKEGKTAGCFTLAFDVYHWFLKANAWFTRFDVNAVRFGDQSLFVSKKIFLKAGGFDENHIVLEDQEFIKRLRKKSSFTILQKPVISSARKYVQNGIYKTQGVFFLIYAMYRLGFSQQKLVSTYKKFIRESKL